MKGSAFSIERFQKSLKYLFKIVGNEFQYFTSYRY